MTNTKGRWIVIFLILFAAVTTVILLSKPSYVIGIVNPSKGMKNATTSFIESLAESGYVAEDNVTYIVHSSKKGMEEAVDKMVLDQVDLIFSVTTPATRKAKAATEKSQQPVIFLAHDPVNSGIIQSLPQPGGNLTGIQVRGSTPKALEWLQTIVPNMHDLFVPIAFDTKAAKQSLKDLEMAASKLKINLHVAKVKSLTDLEMALASIPEQVDAIYIPHSILVISSIDAVLEAAVASKLPTVASHQRKEVTISYGVTEKGGGRQASRLAQMVLEGEPMKNIPSEVARFSLSINLHNAKEIGLEISSDVLLQADAIFR